VSGEQPKEGTSGRPTVLVVDDEEMVRVALTRNISRLGCNVVVARDGEEALRIVPELKPAVVFLDLRMPGIDGHALMRRLPELGVAASIVVMSGDANLDDVIDALRNGAVDFLKKPWSTSELASALERGIEVFRTLPQSPPTRTVAPGAWTGLAHARSRTPRPDSAREKLLQRLQSPEPPAPSPGRPAISHLHRSARDLDAANHAHAPTPDEIVNLLEGDPGLATAVLRLANSRLYPGQEETQYLTTAVARVGARMVHAVAETLALRDGYPIRAPDLRTLHERIWRFSVARGLAMRAIAEVTGPEVTLDPDRCYLGGLLLDAGAAFLLWTLDESRPEPFRPDETLSGAAVQVLSSYHPAFGQAVLSRWGMPGDLVALVRDHHAPVPPVPESPMWSASLLARPMAMRVVGFDDPSSSSQPRPELLDRCAYDLGVGETVLRRLSVTLADDTRVHWELYA